ncbi:MAG: CDP-alcohol phosphatidyltransferase family protein [Vitreimonas sp.]
MASPTQSPPTLETLKAQNFDRAEPPVYRLLRRVTVWLTLASIPTPITPNQITLLGNAISIGAAVLAATGDPRWLPTAGIALLIGYVLDCMDGELARAREQSSRLGIHLEHLGNWVLVGVLQMGVAYGAYRASGDATFLELGMLSLFGWYGFYFFFLQAQSWVAGVDAFGALRRFSRWLVFVMPLDENLFILGTLASSLRELAVVSAAFGVGLFAIALVLFLIPAARLHRQGSW